MRGISIKGRDTFWTCFAEQNTPHRKQEGFFRTSDHSDSVYFEHRARARTMHQYVAWALHGPEYLIVDGIRGIECLVVV